MSWSVQAVGKAPAVAAAIEKQFVAMERYPCAEPEETAKQLARKAIAALCAAQSRPDGMAVKVAASGSMSWNGGNQAAPEQVTNNFSVMFETIHGFVD